MQFLITHMKTQLTPHILLTAGENNAFGLKWKIGKLGRARQHLCIHLEASQSSKDQMAGLTAKIEDEDSLQEAKRQRF